MKVIRYVDVHAYSQSDELYFMAHKNLSEKSREAIRYKVEIEIPDPQVDGDLVSVGVEEVA